MFDVRYSHEALNDLDDIWGYITFELMNPDAAINTVNGIMDAVDRLSEYPLSGTPLNVLLEIESEYRFVIFKNYLAFYHLENSAVKDRKSTRLNSSHPTTSRMPSSA